jgi:hypothetical protein
MGLPKKALRESQLEFLTAGTALSDGSHQTYKVMFTDNKIPKLSFYKKIDPKNSYPALLAKISVAVSLFKRIFQGKRSAEERLVFDDEDQLVGTLSIGVEGFKPFNFSNEPIPLDTYTKEQVIPSTKTLIEKNIIEILFGRWFLDDDDGHAHNMSLVGDIDFDMFIYWLTIHIKKPRAVIGVPKTRVALTVQDWERFPNVKDSKPYHWPPYEHPGQETLPTLFPVQDKVAKLVLPKTYADPSQFERLAHEPIAHEQKFAAALKALLTYQPDMMRKRLTDLFGELTLNYTSLDEIDVQLRDIYEKEHGSLFNDKTNVKSFVDFIMNIYQMHYDNLYRVVVFYMGCENNGFGVRLDSTSSTLYSKPSFYKNILEWVKTQNSTLYANDDSSSKFNVKELQKRYHQVWRDSHAPIFVDLLHSTLRLTSDLLNKMSTEKVELRQIEGKKIDDDSLTSVWDLFGTMPELSFEEMTPHIQVDEVSKLRPALASLTEFFNKFHAITKQYYKKDRSELTEEDNVEFSQQLSRLYLDYNVKIRKDLAHTSTPANEFNLISARLKQLTEQINFELHLTTTDEHIKEAHSVVSVKTDLPHTHEDIVSRFNDSLFLWAKGLDPEDLSKRINEIIDKHYAPTFKSISKRQRAEPVRKYLESSANERGDHRLAYILTSGLEDTGALNTLLIEHFTPLVLQTYPLNSIQTAVKSGAFKTDIAVFTKSAVDFARHDKRFVHLYSDEGIKLFYQTMYEWLDKLERSKFKGLINSSLTDYEKGLWSYNSRRSEVKGYCDNFSQAKAVAMVFIKGKTSSTLNPILFDKIVNAIQTDVLAKEALQKRPEYRLFMQYNPDTHKAKYFQELNNHSVEITHRQSKQENTKQALIV